MKITHILLLGLAALTSCSGNKTPQQAEENPADSLYLVVGSYNTPDQEGIKAFMFNQETGDYRYVSGMQGISNPSFIYPTSDGKYIYAVGEDVAPDTATANAISFDAEVGKLTLLNSQPTYGDAPCNITITPDGKRVYTSNYFGGSITEFAVNDNHELAPGKEIKFSGSSVDPERQTKPYLHAVNFTKDCKFLLADDLGTDNVHIFKASEPVCLDSVKDLAIPAGVGPRHLCCSQDGSRAYLLGELSGDVVTISYDGSDFKVIQTLRADSLGAGGSADIHISPDGKFVYASHRLKGDGISILSVNPEDGTLTKIGYQNTLIHPRNFNITPNGKYLLVACRDSDAIQIFSRNQETGMLTEVNKLEMPKPVCIQFIEKAQID